MKTSFSIGLVALVGAAVWLARERSPLAPAASESSPAHDGPSRAAASSLAARDRAGIAPAAEAPRIVATQAANERERALRVQRIQRDYDELRIQFLGAYGAAGESFPGGSRAFLRQLALLERERRADLGAALGVRALEDLELRESPAGRLVTRLLGSTNATEEQQRAVFRLQREFELDFELACAGGAEAFLARERARQVMQEQIRGILGDELFGAWLAGEGDDHALAAAFAANRGLSPRLAAELRAAKNDFVLRMLELNASRLPPEELRAAERIAAHQTELRTAALLGPVAYPAAREELLGWLPKY